MLCTAARNDSSDGDSSGEAAPDATGRYDALASLKSEHIDAVVLGVTLWSNEK